MSSDYEQLSKTLNGYVINTITNDNIFYHGSREGIIGDVLKPCSRDKCDFGKGFYIGTLAKQAEDIACIGNFPKLYEVQIRADAITSKNTIYLSKTDWLFYTLYNRGKLESLKGTVFYDYYSSLDKGKEFVIGAIIDDSYKDCLKDYLDNRITDTVYMEAVDSFNYGLQIVAKTQEACDKIVIVKNKTKDLLSEKPRLLRRQQEVRAKGFELFCEIRDKYEFAEGETFRELLKKAKDGFIPRSYYNKKEIMGKGILRFPDVIHTKGDNEYEPFK